jgi:hypothetical protein
MVATETHGIDRWRTLAAMLAVFAALTGGAAAVSSGKQDGAAVAVRCGDDCQHNQVLL